MRTCTGLIATLFAFTMLSSAQAQTAPAPQVILVERQPDPHGTPRPARNARDVPLRTSLYLELGLAPEGSNDRIEPDSVAVNVQEAGREPIELLRPGRHYGDGVTGWLLPRQVQQGIDKTAQTLTVYLEPGQPLKPETTYSVRVVARSQRGAELPATSAWSFTTEPAPGVHPISFSLDLGAKPVRWHGAFFSGFCNVVSCTQERIFGPTYDLMAQARKEHPRAWMYERGIWLTGTQDRKEPWMQFLDPKMPNIVRERETRHIAAIENRDDGVLVRVDDFFGHEQYGIPSGRSVSEDYHAGDEVLIADGVHDARAKVIAADDKAGTVLLDTLATPPGGWLLDYQEPAPEKQDPDAPGLFRAGGCYLRKFNPHGTACYYWGRLDKEYDLIVNRYGRRMVVNFIEAPNDVSIDGRSFTTAKDYAQWHEVAQTIAGHMIDRYGEKSLTFTWSIFNEPELRPFFWRSDWDELQKFYDYTTDAILRAFEDRGYDSDRVFIGGLELAGIFGTKLNLTEFLSHCSPTATAKGALPLNAAFADKRLDGKRSKRVETMCTAHNGKGAPCNFVSIHSYNRSEITAGKLIRAKEMALEIDPAYYKDLWVNSHESCPDWSPPPDEAAADSYLGNGYFPSWCGDVIGRQLRKAAEDERYAYGETVLTTWPPPTNFTGINAFTRILKVDDNGDGKPDRAVTVPSPIFHALNLISDLGESYWTLPAQQIGSHLVSGFASRDDKGVVRLVLCAHQPQDTQSRSESSFNVTLDLNHLGWNDDAQVQEFRFDREHNSYFRDARALRDRNAPTDADYAQLDALLRSLRNDDAAARELAMQSLAKLDPATVRHPNSMLKIGPVLIDLAGQAKDPAIRQKAHDLLRELADSAGQSFSPAEVQQIQKLAECHATASATVPRQPDGHLRLTATVAGNGLNILVIKPNNQRGR